MSKKIIADCNLSDKYSDELLDMFNENSNYQILKTTPVSKSITPISKSITPVSSPLVTYPNTYISLQNIQEKLDDIKAKQDNIINDAVKNKIKLVKSVTKAYFNRIPKSESELNYTNVIYLNDKIYVVGKLEGNIKLYDVNNNDICNFDGTSCINEDTKIANFIPLQNLSSGGTRKRNKNIKYIKTKKRRKNCIRFKNKFRRKTILLNKCK